MRRLALGSALGLTLLAGGALAKPGAAAPAPSHAPAPTPAPAPPPAPTPSSAPPSATGSVGGCVETVPHGAARPVIIDHFPVRGFSGYAATLVVTVEHGKGETVLPRGVELQSEGEAAKALKDAGFVIPDQTGLDAARLKDAPLDPKHPDHVTTTLELPLLALPPQPGRHTLTLPPLPVAVARANGEIATVCTAMHSIVIEDPTSSTPDPAPKPNPDPRVQREEWTTLKKALTYGAIGVLAGAVLGYLLYRWLQRPKPVPPPPPPRPPWEIALEQLDEVRHAGLLEVGRFQEYFDRVNDAVRAYLGSRYGFDGLESTTDEILQGLRRATLEEVALPAVVLFLEDCDLVKFAKFTPTTEECTRALDAAENIVHSTMPRMRPAMQPPWPPPSAPQTKPPPSSPEAAP